jgi:hypothetical protein
MVVRLSALCAGRSLPPGNFLVLISVGGWSDPRAIVQLEGLCQLKKSIVLKGNGTGDLSACSIVPQQTTTSRAPRVEVEINSKLTNQLTLWSWALLQRPLYVRPLDSFAAFHGTRRFNTEFTRALHLFLSWARPIQSTSPLQGPS